MSNLRGDSQASRRRFLRAVAGVTLAMPALGLPRVGHAYSSYRNVHRLAFEHAHTGERVSLVYRMGGEYVPSALRVLDHFLRDFRTGDQCQMDPQLLDILSLLSSLTRSKQPFQVISAYRSPLTNAMLREQGRGVARSSLHLEGRAIDIRLEDVPLSDLRDAALSLKGGGVGYYPGPDFVHVDTGRVRAW